MECELRARQEMGERRRMKEMGNERETIESEGETEEGGTGVRHHPVPAPLAKLRP